MPLTLNLLLLNIASTPGNIILFGILIRLFIMLTRALNSERRKRSGGAIIVFIFSDGFFIKYCIVPERK